VTRNGVCGCLGCSPQAARNVCGARSVSVASVFGNSVGVVVFSGSHAPNNSFKPTPLRGGLTQALGVT
jgi:hypothetical protein